MTSYKEWNRSDSLSMDLRFVNNPLALGIGGLEPVLDVIEQEAGMLIPDTVQGVGKRAVRYSRQRARDQIDLSTPFLQSFMLSRRKGDLQGYWSLRFGGPLGGCAVGLNYSLDLFRQGETAPARCQQLVHVARTLCERLGPVHHGFAHSYADMLLGSDAYIRDPSSPPAADEAWWLNIYGKPLVDALGRERVLSLPAQMAEPLLCGGVLWRSRPTLADFDSPQARLAQARCLVHLRPELSLPEVERGLLERSLAFQPVEAHFDPSVAELLHRLIQEQTGLWNRRQEVERYNRYRAPPVAEWCPAHEVQPDVEDPASKLTFYEVQAEHLIALLHPKHPSVLEQSPQSIIDVDYYVGRERWAEAQVHMTTYQRDRLVPMLGGYLGELLVKHLGGRWAPRRCLLEAAVVVGPRAWLPFLRAQHLLQVPSNSLGKSLDFTLGQLFHEASQHAHPLRS